MDAQLLIQLQSEKAHRFLKDADDMTQQQRWELAANRYYYACYHIVHAAFITLDITTKTHDGTLTEFGKNFVLTGKIDKQYGRFFARMIQLRLKADYNSVANVSEEEVVEISSLAHDFVESVERLLPE